MKSSTVNALLTGLVLGLLTVIGVLVYRPLPWPGVRTPPVQKPVAAVASAPSDPNTCNYENMPASPALPSSITEPKPEKKFLWSSEGNPYYCLYHVENYHHTGCPMASVLTATADGNTIQYTSVFNHSRVLVSVTNSALVEEYGGLGAAITNAPGKFQNIDDIPKDARNLLYLLTRCATSPAVQGGEG